MLYTPEATQAAIDLWTVYVSGAQLEFRDTQFTSSRYTYKESDLLIFRLILSLLPCLLKDGYIHYLIVSSA